MKTPTLLCWSVLTVILPHWSCNFPPEMKTFYCRHRTARQQLRELSSSCMQPLHKMQKVEHESKCKTQKDCGNTGFVCYAGTCLCPVGLYYSPHHHACVRECSEYGDEMVLYKRAGIKGHNDRIIKHTGLTKCIQLCVDEKAFVCLSADWTRTGKCFLSKSGYLDVESSQREFVAHGWILAQRQCGDHK